MPNVDRPRFKRKLTPFICRELMYDYVTHRLPGIRHSDVEDYIENNESLKTECRHYESSIEYLNRLEKIEVADELIDQLKSSQSIANHVVQASRIRNWPDWLVFMVQLIGTSLLVVLSVVYINWFELNDWLEDNLSFVSVVLDEQVEEPFNPADDVSIRVAEDESGLESDIIAGSDPNIQEESTEVKDPPNEPDTPIEVVQNEDTKKEPPEDVKVEPSATPVIIASSPTPSSPNLKGEVTKIFMGLPNIDGNTKEIVSWLKERGATKAGDVPLGWRRPKGSYFNIRINKEHIDPLVEFLKTKSRVTVDTVSHRIVMAEGEARIILWIRALKEASKKSILTNDKQPETVRPSGSNTAPKSNNNSEIRNESTQKEGSKVPSKANRTDQEVQNSTDSGEATQPDSEGL